MENEPVSSPAELWVLVDGLGWRFANRHSFLAWLAERHPLRTVLGFSSTAVPSLLTGLAPSSHGAWTLYFRSPQTSPFGWLRPLLRLPLDKLPRGRWRLRRWILRETIRRNDIRGYFAVYDVPFAALPQFDVAWRGGLFGPKHDGPRTFLDSWREADSSATIGAYPMSDKEIRSQAENAIAAGARKVFCYFGDLDGVLHKYAQDLDSPPIRDGLQSLDQWIRTQAERMAAAHGAVRVICFSDHGMTPVSSVIDLRERLERLKLRNDGSWFLDSTMARFWVTDANVVANIKAQFADLPGRFLTSDDLVRERLPNRPKEFGQLVWLANPGVCIAPSWMGRTAPSGMHGYSPDDPWSDGIVMSSDTRIANCEDVVSLGQALQTISRF